MVTSEPAPDSITALILAGGEGSRLREVTPTPKTIVPVLGKPFLFHLLEALRYRGIRRVIIGTGYQADLVEKTMQRWNPGLELTFSRETEPLGTAGALRRAAALVATPLVLAMNGDSWCEFGMKELLPFHAAHPAGVSLVAFRVEDAGRFGALDLDETGRVGGFQEKSRSSGPGWINAGLYLLPTQKLREISERTPLSLEREVMPLWLAEGVHAFCCEGPFLDIGTPESFAQKEDFIRTVTEARQGHARETMFSLVRAPDGIPLKAGVGVLLENEAGEVLLEKRSDCGWWGLVGGAMLVGESVEETVRREVREETGLDAVVIGLVGVYSRPATHLVRYPDRGDVKQLLDIVVLAKMAGGAPQISEESDELCFFSRDNLPPESEIIPPAREPLRDWVRGVRGVLA